MVGNGKLTGSVRKETNAVSDTIWMGVQNRHSRILVRDILRSRMWKMHQESVVPKAEAQVGEWLDCRARITSKELAPLHSVKNDILQNACSASPKMDADLGKSARMRIARLMNSVAKGLKRMVTKVWLCWKLHDNWVCAFQDMQPPKSTTILRKNSNILKPIRCVRFIKSCYVMLTFETRIHRLEWFAQVILISVTPMLQNLRIGLKKRRNGKSDVPVKQRGNWPKIS